MQRGREGGRAVRESRAINNEANKQAGGEIDWVGGLQLT